MNYRRKISAAVLMALFLISGCAAGMSHIRAGVAEVRGDSAYQRNDFDGAFGFYQAAAEFGGARGQYMLATMYMTGEGTKRNPELYLHWMGKAAEGGYPSANYLMGMANLSRDPAEMKQAVEYLKRAAGREHAGAMHVLGLIYASGTGVTADAGEALRWFRLARSQGFPVENALLTREGIAAYSLEMQQAALQPAPQIQTPRTPNLLFEIQRGLTELGYDPGPVDGIYGNKTKSAIQAFQKDRGLTPDGAATQRLLDSIMNRKR